MCVEPTTALVAASIASTAVSAGASIMGGIGEQRLANQQARAVEAQGRQQQQVALREEESFRRRSARERARQRLQFLAAGVDPSTGSAADVAAADAATIELDALTIRYGGEVARKAAEDQAYFRRQEGISAARAGVVNAGAEVLGQVGTWGALRRPGGSPTGNGGPPSGTGGMGRPPRFV